MCHLILATQVKWQHLSGILWCNNKAAVDKFNKIKGDLPYSITEANNTNADVLQELFMWKNKLSVSLTASWVKAHQSAPTTREGRLNNVVDKSASAQHNTTGKWASKRQGWMLPSTRAQLLINNTRLTKKIDRGVQLEIYRESINQYIVQKLGIQECTHLVDWAPIKWHHRQLSLQQRATRLKFIFHWTPTNARKVKTGQSVDPLCPFANSTRRPHIMSSNACRRRIKAIGAK